MIVLAEFLAASAALHRHLCPRQVLGVRMGLLAGDFLGIDLPQTDKRLLAIVETDGCFCDGISEVVRHGNVLCRSCAGQGYYHIVAELAPLLIAVEERATCLQ